MAAMDSQKRMKPTTSVTSSSFGKQPSASAVASADTSSKDADVVTPLTPVATATSAPSGLDLLFSASQVETKPEVEAEGDVAFPAEEASPTTAAAVVSDGGSAEGRYGSNRGMEDASTAETDSENPAFAAAVIKNDVKSFPEILQEILATQEYQSIIHWLPDGFSFIIADKQKFIEVILRKYFREALFHSFIRKLNRWGFRRVKSRRKGEESSFAHINFVRDQPRLCLKMKCKSKPTYHKISHAEKKTAAKALHNAVSAMAPPSFLAAGGMKDITSFPAVTAVACSPIIGTAVATIQERQCLASIPEYQERILRERQILMLQMRQRNQIQSQLQLLHDMFAPNSMMAQYTHDMLRRNIYYGRGR
eukprot:scaffold269_cov140-Skeletonema_menzelii.AAC.3